MLRTSCLVLLVLACAAPAIADEPREPSFWSIRDRIEEVVVPDCPEVCAHTLGLFQAGLPGKEAKALMESGAQLTKECLASCEADLDTMARRCITMAQTLEAFDRCKAAHEARMAPPAPPEAPEVVVPPPPPAPTCEAVCRHILEMAVQQIANADARSTPTEVDQYLPQCVAECEADLDDEARRCFMAASTIQDGEGCDEALDARRPPAPDPDRPFYEE